MKSIFLLIFLLILMINYTYCQKYNEKKYLIIKVVYQDKLISNQDYICDYAIISLNYLNNFNFIIDSTNTPNIIYNITANSGYYLSQNLTSLSVYGCCNYGDIKIGIDNYLKNELPLEKLKKFENIEKLSFDKFSGGKKLCFRDGKKEYYITIWEADIKFCVCPLYMESPTQSIFDYSKSAYITEIKYIHKPSKNVAKKFKKIVLKLIYNK
jgi:hypothetical protein